MPLGHFGRVTSPLYPRREHRSTSLATQSGLFNLVAFLAIIAVVTFVLVIGIKESANFNTGTVIVKASIRAVIYRHRIGHLAFKHPELVETELASVYSYPCRWPFWSMECPG